MKRTLANQLQQVMVNLSTFVSILSILFISACSSISITENSLSDANIRSEIIGVWSLEGGSTKCLEIFDASDRYSERCTVGTTNALRFESQGRWEVRNGFLIITVVEPIQPASSPKTISESDKIILINNKELIYEDSHGKRWHLMRS